MKLVELCKYVKKLMKRRLNTFWNNYNFKEKNGVFITKMFYVGLFIMLMTIQK